MENTGVDVANSIVCVDMPMLYVHKVKTASQGYCRFSLRLRRCSVQACSVAQCNVPERRDCRLLLEGWWRPVNVKGGCHTGQSKRSGSVLRSTA
jgi:hypothetical protein